MKILELIKIALENENIEDLDIDSISMDLEIITKNSDERIYLKCNAIDTGVDYIN